MAEKASALVSDAVSNLSVRAAELPLSQDEVTTGIRYMNRMAAALNAQKIDLGYTVITAPSDSVTIPDGAVEGFVSLLTVALSVPFKKPVTPAMSELSRQGLQALRAITIKFGPAQFPSTLPRGSGNEGSGSESLTSHFYADLQSTILAETNGNIALEDATP